MGIIMASLSRVQAPLEQWTGRADQMVRPYFMTGQIMRMAVAVAVAVAGVVLAGKPAVMKAVVVKAIGASMENLPVSLYAFGIQNKGYVDACAKGHNSLLH
ncbi:hypothetical protein [Bartonella sp. DGB2]|uniref:hypothetical protein n=1 Tax=Bartonella sp. DGB2 TaxID=3388426 RepID=UPI00398FF58A